LPTTISGAAALLRHVASIEGRDWSGGHWPDLIEEGADYNDRRCWTFFMHQNLANALEQIAKSAVAS
jgi:hypothetical protein